MILSCKYWNILAWNKVSQAAHYAPEPAPALQRAHFCVAVEMFVSKCFIPHPGRHMYHTLSHFLKAKEGIQCELLTIKTKRMKTIYN